MKVLFICKANLCRSVMAEALFNKEASDQGLEAQALSAGLMGFGGIPPTPETVASLQGLGLDVESHEASPLSPPALLGADLVVTLTQGQKEAIEKKLGDRAPKMWTLKEAGGGSAGDVEDPTGSDGAAHDKIRDEIHGLVKAFVGRIKKGEIS